MKKSQTILLVIIFWTLFGLGNHAQAHLSHRMAPAAMGNGVGIFSRQTLHSAYGFYDSYQEPADTINITDFSCDESDVKGYLQNACREHNPSGAVIRRVTPAMEVAVLTRLREQALEYFGIYQEAIDPDDAKANPRTCPECVNQDSPQCLDYLAGYPNSGAGANKVINQAKMLQNENLVTTLIRYDTLRANFQRLCVPRETEPQQCFAMEEETYRIELSYPIFFGETVQGKWRHEKPRTDKIRSALKKLLGMKAGATSEADALTQGGEIYNRLTSSHRTADHEQIRLDLTTALKTANAANFSTPWGQAAAGYTAQLHYAKNELKKNFRTYADRLCQIFNTRSRQSTREALVQMAFSSAPVIRQALLDMPPTHRDMTRAVLCARKIQPHINRPRECAGVTADPDNPLRTKVDRSSYLFSWPYGSDQRYTITDSPTGKEVAIRINMVTSEENRAATQQMATQMQLEANQFFNCQSGTIPSTASMTCPPSAATATNPPIRFNIQYHVTTDPHAPEPAFNIHECFNAELSDLDSRSNCAAVRAHQVEKCVAKKIARSTCESTTPPVRHADNNRANASNLTLNTPGGTMRHETAHLLGLPDEYVDNPYDTILSPTGENNSLMYRSKHPNARLYPRHFDHILAPQHCRQD